MARMAPPVRVVILALSVLVVLAAGAGVADRLPASPSPGMGKESRSTGRDGRPGELSPSGLASSSPRGNPAPAGSFSDVPGEPSSAIAHASDAGGKEVNITIDDGPSPVFTRQVLDVLKRYHAEATFCMIGPRAALYPGIVRRVVAEGHRLCDHSVSHDERMNKKPFAYQRAQILNAQMMISRAAGGAGIDYYRAPGGAFTPYSRLIAVQHGMRPLGWNVDTKDWERPGTAKIIETAKHELGLGPTILFHDGGGDRTQTVAALQQLLPWLASHGYTFGFPVR
ncbi:polysaccharide deacetylase family protein [Streptomyces sp. NPDC058251]|uniref:polysaccharide deacetylase family protein n=1 Tax=unclassified Streptomyces TaxID=2593676 RepID=UPI00364D93B9